MPDRTSATGDGCQQKATHDSYFAPLAQASHMLLTTFKPNGIPVSIPVRGVARGDRAYFRVWSRSGTAKRLRRSAPVQVTPCTVLGLCSYGPPLGATARLLPCAEASQVASRLSRTSPVQHGLLSRLLPQTWRMLHYELLP